MSWSSFRADSILQLQVEDQHNLCGRDQIKSFKTAEKHMKAEMIELSSSFSVELLTYLNNK